MKLAYIILGYDNPLHVKRLLKSLNNKNIDIYIHVDYKSNLNTFLINQKNIFYENERTSVYWGEFNQVLPVIKLLKKAIVANNYDYFILLYGSDYPILENNQIENYLDKHRGKEFINITSVPKINKTIDRFEYFHFLNSNRNKSFIGIIKRILNQCIRLLNIKRKIPQQYKNFQLYGGTPWWILSHDCIEYCINYIKDNPEFVNFWKNTLIPDETFFHTIIGNSKFMKRVVPNVMYTNWVNGESNPRIITDKDLPILKKGEFTNDYGKHDILFARKFNDSSGEIIKKIDSQLRKNNEKNTRLPHRSKPIPKTNLQRSKKAGI